MSPTKPVLRLFSVFFLAIAITSAALPRPLLAQQATAAKPAADYTAALEVIEKTLDEKRKELGIPGIALAIVKDDQIIYLKGLGEKDIEKKLPVTPDTASPAGAYMMF